MGERIAVHGLIIKDKTVLMVEKGIYDIFPGGKIEKEELEEDCLIRETAEELSGTKIYVGKYYKNFKGITPNSKIFLISKTYFCYPLDRIGEPSNKITKKKFVTSEDIPNLNLTEISKKTLLSLIEDDLII